MKTFFLLLVAILVGCTQKSIQPSSPPPAVKPDWILKSDQIAEQLTKSLATLHPEIGSEIGYAEYNKLGTLISPDIEEQDRTLYLQWIEKLSVEKSKTKDLELNTDLDLLQNWLKDQVSTIDIRRESKEVEFNLAAKFVYHNLQFLVGDQSSVESKKAVVDRFKLYVHGDSQHPPLLEGMQQLTRQDLKKFKGHKMLTPYRGAVEEYLKDSPQMVAGIEELLQKSGRTDWRSDFEQFKKQASEYSDFIRKEMLPIARKDSRLPLVMYKQILKKRGIVSTPQELVQRGFEDYQRLSQDFKKQAVLVAMKYKLSQSEPAQVIQFLKSKPITNPKEVEMLYKAVDLRLEKIMKDNNLISVPSTPLRIRFAGEAESLMVPVPHLNIPPLVNNKGERPEFVVPSSEKAMPFDDFSSPHSAIVLTAHEGRPGHDMQFSQMLDKGVSVIRSRYALNNVNIEGWALYAEDLVYPYLTEEEKLFALQTRLWRVARMFLDPQIQLGLISDQRVLDVFTKELGVSSTMAGLELRRYKYEDVGQAPSYYEGYIQVKQMQQEAQKRLGPAFSLKCFNDRLLALGVLPLRMSAERMKEAAVCP